MARRYIFRGLLYQILKEDGGLCGQGGGGIVRAELAFPIWYVSSVVFLYIYIY
jgi:hypothetical protein